MIAKKSRKGARKPRLSPKQMAEREKAIIEDIKAGVLSYREIAAKHGVSLPTVNNKARKAGISRGRRKGAKIVVAPIRRGPKKAAKKVAKKAGRKAAKKAGRKAARKVAKPAVKRAVKKRGKRVVRKAARRVLRRRRALPAAASKSAAPVVRRRRRRKVARRAAPAAGRARGHFLDALREVVLRFHPNVSLLKFEKMLKAVEAAVV